VKNSLILALLALILASCGSNFKSNNNLAYLYKKEKTSLHPYFKVYHRNDSISELHFSILGEELLYVRNPANDLFTARLSLTYKLYSSYQQNQLIDSATVVLKDANPEELNKVLEGKFDIAIPRGSKYILKVSSNDLNKNRLEHKFIPVNKVDRLSEQNFLVKDAKTDRVLHSMYVRKGQKLRIEYNRPVGKMKGVYYNRIFRMPPPPFASYTQQPFDYSSDSSFTYRTGSVFKVPREGFYHFMPSEERKGGLSIFQFSEKFPYLKSIDDMLFPMRFIMSRKDFDFLNKTGDRRKAVENFWVEASGNQDKAKNLIEQYYSRVENANYHFSSHVEGWKTDRGMIYLIFGQPNVIYRTGTSETWIYGEEGNQLSLNFVFIKVINPFTDNHFVLNRSPIYKNPWYRAVDEWRAGRAYNL
jgi:GWxTD domain-containing protein